MLYDVCVMGRPCVNRIRTAESEWNGMEWSGVEWNGGAMERNVAVFTFRRGSALCCLDAPAEEFNQ